MIATIVVIAAVLAAYVFILRPVLRAQPQLDLAARAESWRTRIGARLKGWRTILWARFLIVAGILLPLLDAVRTIEIAALLPPAYVAYAPLILTAIGLVTEVLRRLTTTPVGTADTEA